MAQRPGTVPTAPPAVPARAYWDAGTAAPLHPRAREALLAACDDGWADPRRLHGEGRRARLLLDGAREAVAQALGVRPPELTFTPSHTVAVHSAVLGCLAGRRRSGDVLVHSAVEHSAVLHAARHHVAAGGRAEAVAVDEQGRVDVELFTGAVASPGAAVAALQDANGEVGTVQPTEPVLAAARRAGVPLVVDAAASLGHRELPAGWDVLAAGAAGFGGPAGVGLLAVRTSVRWRSPWPGDDHEQERFPGEVSVPAVLAAAVALQWTLAERQQEAARRDAVVSRLRERVPRLVPDVQVVGHPDQRLPHVLTFSCLYVDGEALVGELDRLGFAVGSGSACTASSLEPSHVLAAMGVLTHGNVRIGLPAGTPPGRLEQDAERFLDILPGAVRRVRDLLGSGDL